MADKYFSEIDVEAFQMFNIELPNDAGLMWYTTPLSRGGGQVQDVEANKVDPMNDTSSPQRIARVEELAAFYASHAAIEVSPFTDSEPLEDEDDYACDE